MNLNKIIDTLQANNSIEDRETILNVENKNVKLYTSDAAFLRHYRKRIQAGLDAELLKIVKQDKYGITFECSWKYLKLNFPIKSAENTVENE